MSSRFDRFLIKGQPERTERLFVVDQTTDQVGDVDIAAGRLERHIIPDAQARYEGTLHELGLEQITTLEEGFAYPTFDQWVAHRVQHGRSTKFFPSMLRSPDGRTLFCKSQVSPDELALEGLAVEAERLQNLPADIMAPRFVRYLPPQEGHLAMLITAAFTMDEAAPGAAEDWTTAQATNAASQIKQMEAQPTSVVDIKVLAKNLFQFFERLNIIVRPEIIQTVEETLLTHADQLQGSFVHGDPDLKNLLLGVDDVTVYFTDWEYHGAGFVGQDAAKIWRQLKDLPSGRAFLASYLSDPDGSINTQRKSAIQLGVNIDSFITHCWSNYGHMRNGLPLPMPAQFEAVQQLETELAAILPV